MIQTLLDCNREDIFRIFVDKCSHLEIPFVLAAIRSNNSEILSYLLNKNIDPNIMDLDNMNALMFSAVNQQEEYFDILLRSRKCNIYMPMIYWRMEQTTDNQTIFDFVMSHCSNNMIKTLLDIEDIDMENKNNNYPLVSFVLRDHCSQHDYEESKEIAKNLINRSISSYKKEEIFTQALNASIKNGCQFLDLLLDTGIVSIRNAESQIIADAVCSKNCDLLEKVSCDDLRDHIHIIKKMLELEISKKTLELEISKNKYLTNHYNIVTSDINELESPPSDNEYDGYNPYFDDDATQISNENIEQELEDQIASCGKKLLQLTNY